MDDRSINYYYWVYELVILKNATLAYKNLYYINYRTIRTKDDHIKLQNDLDQIFQWCKTWNMSLNIDKCEQLHISSKFNPIKYEYKLGDTHLKECEFYKYLGLHIDKQLNW